LVSGWGFQTKTIPTNHRTLRKRKREEEFKQKKVGGRFCQLSKQISKSEKRRTQRGQEWEDKQQGKVAPDSMKTSERRGGIGFFWLTRKKNPEHGKHQAEPGGGVGFWFGGFRGTGPNGGGPKKKKIITPMQNAGGRRKGAA